MQSVAGALGDVLGPITLLNIQGGAYVVAGAFVLVALAPRPSAATPQVDRQRMASVPADS